MNEKCRVGIRYAKADISEPSRHDVYFDGGNWKIHEFFDWYGAMACRICWKFSSIVANFPFFLRKDAADFWHHNLDNLAIAELLKVSLKENRPVLVLDKEYSSFFKGEKNWRMMSKLLCYAFGKAKKRRRNHQRKKAKTSREDEPGSWTILNDAPDRCGRGDRDCDVCGRVRPIGE